MSGSHSLSFISAYLMARGHDKYFQFLNLSNYDIEGYQEDDDPVKVGSALRSFPLSFR